MKRKWKLFLFSLSSLIFKGLLAQNKEVSIIIQPSAFFSVMVNNTEGKFRKNNMVVGYANWGIRYKYNKSTIGIAYSNFPIEMDLSRSHWQIPQSTNGRRFTGIPIYYGFEAATILRKNIAVDLQVGNYFLFNRYTGILGRGEDATDINNGYTYSNARWSFTQEYYRNFGIVPFLGVELRNVKLRKLDLAFGYRRLIGVQQLGVTNIKFQDNSNDPVKNYTLESRGTGNVIFLSASIRVWRRVKENKMITSPFDYPTKTQN